MDYRDILILMDSTAAGSYRAKFGADLAHRWKAHLTGVFLTSEFMLQFGAGESLYGLPPDDIDWLLRDHAKGVEEASEVAKQMFRDGVGEGNVGFDFMKVSGDHPDALIACARRADLVVMPARMAVYMGQKHVSAADVAMASGGPVLVTPTDDYAPPVGKRVLVAWNGSREAARALRDGWPFIRGADEIHVLMVSPSGVDDTDAMLLRLLERHGVKPNLIVDSSKDEHAADVIVRQMAELDIDLLIAGLYGHPRLQEWVLGGVSRQLLRDVPAPLLLSH